MMIKAINNNLPHLPLPSHNLTQLYVHFSSKSNDETDTPAFLANCLSISAIIIAFWPIFLNLILVLATASGWLVWIVISIISGLFQLAYVVYQYFRISLDVIILSILKTFAMLRSRLLYYSVSWFGLSMKGERPGRRREWKRKLSDANSFSDFQKILIDEPASEDDEDDGKLFLRKLSIPLKDITSDVVGRNLSFKTGKNRRSTSGKEHGVKSETESPSCPTRSENKEKKAKSQSCVDLASQDLSSSKNLLSPDQITHSKSQESLIKQFPEPSSSSDIERQLGKTGGLLLTTTHRLRESRIQAEKERDSSSLKFLLSGIVKRNYLNIDDILVDDASSVAESGRHRIPREARNIISDYVDEVEKCLDWLATSKVSAADGKNEIIKEKKSVDADRLCREELSDRLKLLHQLKQNTGCTALMLSGGGAQTMNHLGTLRALIESGVYSNISVISGTSGGSTIAAMCAFKTPEELLRDFCIPTVSTDYKHTGEMKRHNIRWFPTLLDMATFWMKHKLLIDCKEVKKCCDFYYGDITFEEAFKRTGKHVCITVSASRGNPGGGSAQRLLLNHISTPHVTLGSAVLASCALPGVTVPAKLQTKDKDGRIAPFEVDGTEWIDGSVHADLPFRRISTLFNVSNYIVCQVNFHVLPFLHKPHHPGVNSLYWKLFQMYEWDIRNRVLNLSRHGLFPSLCGHDVSKVFKQKYHGNLTIVPRFTRMQLFGLKILENPTVEDMKFYLKNGQSATWPHINTINHMLHLERAIDQSITRLEERILRITPDLIDESNLTSDDVDTLIKKFVAGKDAEILQKKFLALEGENISLHRQVESFRKQINRLERELGMHSEEKKERMLDD